MNVVKEVMTMINVFTLLSIFILNILILLFRLDVSILDLALGENIAIVIINAILFLICKLGDK